MKTVRYSYLLNNERTLVLVVEAAGAIALHKSVSSAKRARNNDCYDGLNKPGKLVKITFEVLKQ